MPSTQDFADAITDRNVRRELLCIATELSRQLSLSGFDDQAIQPAAEQLTKIFSVVSAALDRRDS